MHGEHNFHANKISIEIKQKTYWVKIATEYFFDLIIRSTLSFFNENTKKNKS